MSYFVGFYSCCGRILCEFSTLGLFACLFRLCIAFVGMQELVARMTVSLEKAATSGQRVRKYNSRHHLRKDMVRDHPLLWTSRGRVDKDEGFSFPEDVLASCTRVESTVPFLTMVKALPNCVIVGAVELFCGNCGATSGLH